MVLVFIIFLPIQCVSDNDEWARLNELLDIFDEQIDRLDDRGCPEFIIDRLCSMKFKVVDRACNMSIRRGNIPFLPVIPDSWLSYARQMEMVTKDGATGTILLDTSNIENWDTVPPEPYYIFDVNDGWEFKGTVPSMAEVLIKKNLREPLFTEELISLCIHSNVLSRHNVDALRSRVGKSGVPSIIMKKEIPVLDWCYIDTLSPNCGFPHSRNLRIK